MAGTKKSSGKKAAPAKAAPEQRKPAKPKASGNNTGLLVGAGIGSAAIAAAVLWVSRAKKKPEAPTR
ncbi:hypothetical protein FHS31_001439 [Sphingomonas vulcanisoli]|uniref:LPXTG cell wall anchor domain-containing protein n=1 Tax=Sphingomonas vulcanisoli TaxID=1658060 RepID=A0ABX0TSV7_9SPHN|nr:hypothetical protein [Sphingomonas vulcanisoli]NIJ07829.1 hypothetical protein [Sphingomonas vulcanisoli]